MKTDRCGNLHDEKGKFACKSHSNLLTLYTGSPKLPFKIGLDFFSEKSLDEQGLVQLKKGVRKLNQRIKEHRYKISNPDKFYEDWHSFDEKHKSGILHKWEKEIRNFQNDISNREAKIKELES